MLASGFIRAVQALISIHGDLPIQNEYGQDIDSPEFNTDEGPCILVSFYESDDD
jgi:hypothetical protein